MTILRCLPNMPQINGFNSKNPDDVKRAMQAAADEGRKVRLPITAKGLKTSKNPFEGMEDKAEMSDGTPLSKKGLSQRMKEKLKR